jgi:hypothetical protein
MKNLLRDQRGSVEVLSWVVIIPILMFLLMITNTWLNLDRQKAVSAMAARDAARVYGIELGQKNPQAAALAQARAKDILASGNLMKPTSGFIPWGTHPSRGQNGVAISLSESTDAFVTLQCHVVNPFPNITKLIQLDVRPYHFSYTVQGRAQIEAQAP